MCYLHSLLDGIHLKIKNDIINNQSTFLLIALLTNSLNYIIYKIQYVKNLISMFVMKSYNSDTW